MAGRLAHPCRLARRSHARPLTAFHIVSFDSNSSTLTRRAQDVPGGLARIWKKRGGDFMELQGFADGQEARTARPSISQERAGTVKSYLVAQGISPGRIATQALGASRQLVLSDAADPQNRRLAALPRFREQPEAIANRLACRDWVRNRCFAPSRLAHAGANACGAAWAASQAMAPQFLLDVQSERLPSSRKFALLFVARRSAIPPYSLNVPAASAAAQRQRPAPHSTPAGPATRSA